MKGETLAEHSTLKMKANYQNTDVMWLPNEIKKKKTCKTEDGKPYHSYFSYLQLLTFLSLFSPV